MRGGDRTKGFTLIELSIVLVIIGLIVGGILVGQDLIKAAEVRAQISQIEKYNQAVNTFRAKFGGLPGDLAISNANQFGFAVPGSCTGQQGGRDGNGLLDGYSGGLVLASAAGETSLFWMDLTNPAGGNLIEGAFPNSGAPNLVNCSASLNLNTSTGTTFIGDYYPLGKIGHGTFVYVYETSGYNWYGLSAITSTSTATGIMLSSATLPVVQAYNIDRKVDDGLPASGSVQATYINNSLTVVQSAPSAAADTTTTCYNTTSNTYSLSSAANYGAGGNCALSFRFQ